MLPFILLVLLFSRLSVAQDHPDWNVMASYEVGPGDLLKVEVYGEEDLGREVMVSSTGRIDLPLLGEVDVAGLTEEQIARRLEEAWGKDYLVDPHVSVRILSYGSKPVQVLGAVHKPGQIYLTRPTLLLDILAQAGGIVSEKSAKEVQIKRVGTPDGKPILVRLDDLVTSGVGNIPLQAGDVVYVPEGLHVYVMGEVQKPGPVVYYDGLTVTGALTAAGGHTSTAKLRSAYILRGQERLKVNIKRILKGREPDPVLMPSDRLYLEQAIF